MMQRPISRRRPQLSLGSLLMLIGLVAILLAWYRTHRQLAQLQQQVKLMSPIARDLRIDDPGQISVVDRLPTLSRETMMDFYLPPPELGGASYQLCLVLDGIVQDGAPDARFPTPDQSVEIPPGTHVLELRHFRSDISDPVQTHQVEILLDENVVMQATRPAEWDLTNGWSTNVSYKESKSFQPDEVVELQRRRFNEPTQPGSRSSKSVDWDQPANGILIWIQPIIKPDER